MYGVQLSHFGAWGCLVSLRARTAVYMIRSFEGSDPDEARVGRLTGTLVHAPPCCGEATRRWT